MKRLLILAGDGIGPEVMAETRRVVEWFAERRGLAIALDEEPFGIAAWDAHGDLLRPATWRKIEACDAILFGATGSSEYERIPAAHRVPERLLHIRKQLDLFINLRPVRAWPMLSDVAPLRPEVIAGTDLVLVRELSGGLYFGTPRGIETAADGSRTVVNTMHYTSTQIERIARAAFDLARSRRGRLCSVDKGNVLENGVLWREIVTDVHARDYGDVELSHLYVDNCAMQLVRAPSQFDVLVTENLFGDILSDCAAMAAGSIGLMPSASLSGPDAHGRRHALYEPIHGSAPDIAGQGIANPLASILAFALCLRHTFDAPDEATLLERSIDAVLATGVRTRDIAVDGRPTVSTSGMGDAVLEALARANR